MAKKPVRKAPKKSAPKKAPARRSSAMTAESSASSYTAPEMSSTVREHGSLQQGAKRSPITGILILAVPVVIGVALVVFKDSIFPPGPETTKTESTMRSGDPQKPGEKPADAKKPGDKPADAKKPGDKPADKKPEVKPDGKSVEYTVAPGDTLAKIAAAKLGNANRAQEIVVLNPGLNANAMKAGQKIKIPAK